MELRVLLITHYLIQKLLIETISDVYIRGVKIKKFIDIDVVIMYVL
jgi:hypothetical protein